MHREPTEAEVLFDKLSEIASEAGFNLCEVRMASRPRPGFKVSAEYRLRTREDIERLPSPSILDNIFG